MVGVGDISHLSRSELKQHFNEAKKQGADFLVIHSYSYPGFAACSGLLGGGVINFSEKALPVRNSHQLEDLLKADIGDGALSIQAVYDLSKSFSSQTNKVAEKNIALIQEAVDEAKSEFEKRYNYRAYIKRPLRERLFTPTPPKPTRLEC